MSSKRIQEAFDGIHASEDLKEKTKSYLHERISQESKSSSSIKNKVSHTVDVLRGKISQLSVAGHKVRYIVAAAAAVVILFVGIGVFQVWNSPVSFISVDVNPSVELGINRWERVVDVHAFNLDGEGLLSLDLKGKMYKDAVETLLSQEIEDGLVKEDSYISLTVRSEDNDAESTIVQSLQEYANQTLQGYEVHCGSMPEEIWNQAHEHGLSAGKYKAILQLLELDDTATIEEYKDKSMREIKNCIDACSSSAMAGENGAAQSQNGNKHVQQGTGQGQNSGEGYGQKGQHHGQGQNNGNDSGQQATNGQGQNNGDTSGQQSGMNGSPGQHDGTKKHGQGGGKHQQKHKMN